MNVPIELKPFLEWLGQPVIIGILASMLLTRWSGFQGLDSDTKRVVSFLIVFSLGVGFYLLRTYAPPDLIETLNPIFNAGMVAALPYIASQFTHAATNKTPAIG